jgi:hypothetical protein
MMMKGERLTIAIHKPLIAKGGKKLIKKVQKMKQKFLLICTSYNSLVDSVCT